MTPFLQLILSLGIILLAAKLVGYLATRLGQPSVLGEMLVGLILGPSLVNLTHLQFMTDQNLPEVISEIGELGVLLLMFMAGLELHFSELAHNSRISSLASVLGVVFPTLLGVGAGKLFGYDTNSAIFLGLALSATSVSISAQTLMELKLLRTRVGLSLLGAAVLDDIIVILVFSGFLALTGSGDGLAGILWVFIRMLIFLSLSTAFGLWVLPVLAEKASTLPVSQAVLTFALVIMLVYGLAAEIVGGMAAITGTFIAGLMFSRTPQKAKLEAGLSALAYSFFVPIFFVNIGLTVNLHQFTLSAFLLLLVASAAAMVGKLSGAGLGARLGGLSWRESMQLGTGMISRGEVSLIAASVGMTNGLVSQTEFSAIVGVVLVSTLVTPPLLHAVFKPQQPAPIPIPIPKVESETRQNE
jgi:Kef-type K+ transport system membrane component KefB